MKNKMLVVDSLIEYALKKALIVKADEIYFRNQLIHLLDESVYQPSNQTLIHSLPDIFTTLFEGSDLMTYQKEALQEQLINVFALRPSKVIERFEKYYRDAPQQATQWFYQYCQDINYIKDASANLKWLYKGQYGELQMTINLAKPEKDVKEIAQLVALKQTSTDYPICPICKENEGYFGTIKHAARSNLRLLPLRLNNEEWFMQYSPYSYYNEHTIVLKGKHEPMHVNEATFERLIDFCDYLPHYFIGSNAGLPIVGGSILNHDHFQGGHHLFPMMEANSKASFQVNDHLRVDLLDWYMSSIKVTSDDRHALIDYLTKFYHAWLSFEAPELDIIARSGDLSHQAITPVMKKVDGVYHAYVTVRNNRTNDTFPEGIFHPHRQLHHIKKENIGLIEVLGCAILPGRLKQEINLIYDYLILNQPITKVIEKHLPWLESLQKRYDFKQMTRMQFDEMIEKEIAIRFELVLKDASVFKETPESQKRWYDFVASTIPHQ